MVTKGGATPRRSFVFPVQLNCRPGGCHEMSGLIGRETELRVCDELLTVVRRGTGEFLVITGEPGIGKTSLLTALLASAERRG